MSQQHHPGEEPTPDGVAALDDMLGPVDAPDEDTAPIEPGAATGAPDPDDLDDDGSQTPTQVMSHRRPAQRPIDPVPPQWWQGDPATDEPAYDRSAYDPRSATARTGGGPATNHPAHTPAPVQPPTPAAPHPSQQGAYRPPTYPRVPERRRSPLLVPLLLIGALLAGAVLAVGALELLRSDEPTASATGQSPPTDGPSDQETSSPTSEPTTSSPTSARRRGVLPAGGTACAGPKDGVRAARGSDVTSCEFAEVVRDAYAQASPGDDGSASLDVVSPVTGKRYTMRCSGAEVTKCTGGNNAVVYLY